MAETQEKKRLEIGNLLKEEFLFSTKTFFAPVLAIAQAFRHGLTDAQTSVHQSVEQQHSVRQRSDDP